MGKKLIPMAIAYDFDGTLAPGYMQHHSFMPDLGIKPADFWKKVKKTAKENDMDEILTYMELMLSEARHKGISIHKKSMINHGKGLKFFDGVEDWFDRINTYAKTKGIKLEHYIISSGLREMVEGTSIAKHFKYIFASGYKYNKDGIADWPALAVNYTNKTQYLFRINKGVLNSYDNEAINKFVSQDNRPIPFENMIYLGDGETDVPSMKMIKYQGGYAIGVYEQNKRSIKGKKTPKIIAHELLTHDRADFALPANYSRGSDIELVIQGIIDKVEADARLKNLKTGK